MSKVSVPGFLFIHSGVFDKSQVEANLKWCIKQLQDENEGIGDCDLYVNVVEDKNGNKFGHTYAWVSNDLIFNALVGDNFDGSPRVTEMDDPNWKPPDTPFEEAIKEAKGDWGEEAEIEAKYECPIVEQPIEPLIVPPGVLYTEEQRTQLKTTDEIGFIDIFKTRVTIRSDDHRINSIYSTDVPSWVTSKMLRNFFFRFSMDKSIHYDSKSKRNIQYPLIEISKFKTSNNTQITFSPLDTHLSHFVMKIAKKIIVTNPKTNENAMIFFSQSKKPKRPNY